MAECLTEEDEELAKSLFFAQFHIWYPKFEHLTIPSKIIKISKEFVEYLSGEQSREDSDEEMIFGEGEEASEPTFPILEKQTAKCIKSLGGCVFAKLNWSAPCDAAWTRIGNSLKCNNFSEICDLLKASDTISSFDLCENIVLCVSQNSEFFQHFLVLREWREIHLCYEFRCFVKNGELIAVSQRNHSDYYSFLCQMKMEVLGLIRKFFETEMKKILLFPNCVFDCYIEAGLMKVILLDFSPFNELTDALLYTWEELNQPLEGVKIRMKEAQGIYPNEKTLPGKIPKDFMDMASGEDSQKLLDLMNLSKDDFQKFKY